MSDYKIQLNVDTDEGNSRKTIDLIDDWDYNETEARDLWAAVKQDRVAADDAKILISAAEEMANLEIWWRVVE